MPDVSPGDASILQDDYKKTLDDVFDVALSKLQPNAKHLLNIMAFMNPDAVPLDMLSAKHDDPGLRFLSNPDELNEIVRDLQRRQLVKSEAGNGTEVASLSMDRTLQSSILHRVSQDDVLRAKTFRQAFEIIKQQLPQASRIQVSQPHAIHKYEKCVPHLLCLRSHSLLPEPPIELNLEFAKVLTECGTFMWHTGLIKDGEQALLTAEQILVALRVDDQSSLLSDIDGILGIIDDHTGVSRRTDSYRRRERALAIRSSQYDAMPADQRSRADEIRLYNAWANLGCTLLQDERFADALKIFENCLTQYKSWAPEDEIPFEYAKYYNHTAFVRRGEGKPQEAIILAKRACALQEMHGGPLAPLTLQYRFSLGNHYYHAGMLKESLEINEAVLAARRQVCGEYNVWTLESYSMTGSLLSEYGDHTKARLYLDHCLQTQSRMRWTHEGVAMAYFRHSRILAKLGHNAESKISLQNAETIREEFLQLYSRHLSPDPNRPDSIYDQLIPIWAGRLTQKHRKGSTTSEAADEHNSHTDVIVTKFLPGPPLTALRVANPSDILRCGIVAAASFRYSPLFRWERPHHTAFPEDTLLSYRSMAMDAVKSEDVICIVVEDHFDPDEESKSEAIIPHDNGWKPPAAGQTVIAGWAAIKLEPGTRRRGQYTGLEGTFPDLPHNPGRDLNRKHYDSWGEISGSAKKDLLKGCSLMNALVVHPAYWRRGHGTALVKWSVELCKLDKVDQGVSAAAMGAKLYKELGYVFIKRIEDKGDEDDPQGVFTELLRYFHDEQVQDV